MDGAFIVNGKGGVRAEIPLRVEVPGWGTQGPDMVTVVMRPWFCVIEVVDFETE